VPKASVLHNSDHARCSEALVKDAQNSDYNLCDCSWKLCNTNL